MKVAEENDLKIVLIDDDPYELKLLAHQLKRLGYLELMLCEHARDALALLETQGHTIGLVLCDLQMPDIDGVEFVHHLARIGYRGDLVLVSGTDRRVLQTVQKVAQDLRIRVLGAVPKPVSTEHLQRVLASNAPRSATVSSAAHHPFAVHELKRAIAGGELVVHYQPKVEFATGGLIGVEALVRWQHPQGVLLYPDQFIAAAEEHSLIDGLTRAVLTAALRQARMWQDAGLQLQLAVNVSMETLAAPDFPDIVARSAKKAGVALSSLMLEVTERPLIKDLRAPPLDILARLRLSGISLSIVDFGTGHSFLEPLRDIRFDELKLDRSFVSGAAGDLSLRAIVEVTLALARRLDIKSVAIGVENRADWAFLRGLGCGAAQGNFIARPMPGADLLGWLASWESRHRELMAAAS